MPTGLMAFVAAAFLLPLSVLAQPLADRLPPDALVYVGWAGADALSPQYRDSHLKAVLDAGNTPKLVDEFLPRVVDMVARFQPDARQAFEGFAATGHLWRKPWAAATYGIELGPDGQPRPKSIFLCQAGDDAEELHRRLEKLLANVPRHEAPFPFGAFRAGDVVGFSLGYDKPDATLPDGAANSLAANPNFKAALGKVMKSPAFTAYVDAKAFTSLIGTYVEHGGGAEGRKYWSRIREAAGLDGVDRFVWTQGFDGKDWSGQMYLQAPAPRRGLAAMLDARPVGDDVLKTIPATATVAGVARFDFARLFDETRKAAQTIDPEAAEQFDDGVRQLSAMIDMDVRKDLLGAFGDEWAYYADPATGGRGMLGVVVVNRLRDEAKARAALRKLVDSTNRAIVEQGGIPAQVRLRETKLNGVTIHYVGTPLVSPAWAVRDGNLYVGLYPQIVAAATSPAAGRKSMVERPEFLALRKRLLGENASRAASISFLDLPQTAPGSYQTWLMLSSLFRFGDVFGVESPDMLFPTLDVLTQHLAPAGSVTWTDDTGWYSRSISPFPGSTLLAADTGGFSGMQWLGFLSGLGQAAAEQTK